VTTAGRGHHAISVDLEGSQVPTPRVRTRPYGWSARTCLAVGVYPYDAEAAGVPVVPALSAVTLSHAEGHGERAHSRRYARFECVGWLRSQPRIWANSVRSGQPPLASTGAFGKVMASAALRPV